MLYLILNGERQMQPFFFIIMPASIYGPINGNKKGGVERDRIPRQGRQAKREGESPNKIINTQTKD